MECMGHKEVFSGIYFDVNKGVSTKYKDATLSTK